MSQSLVKFTILFAVFSLLAIMVYSQDTKGKTWSAAVKWVKQGDWKNGLKIEPHSSINPMEFEEQYQRNKEVWDKAFAFLNRSDLASLAPGNYPVDGDRAYAIISSYDSKDPEKTQWESHRKYIDLQYVISGKEKIGVAPVAKARVTEAYDETKDIAHYETDGKYYVAEPGTFFLFFPQETHRPGIRVKNNEPVKKLVIKIQVAG
jgi:YhcH/YjgK/YiaL family protein